MRPLVFAACILTAACSSQALDSPTSPSRPVGASARLQTQEKAAAGLPFSGRFTLATSGTVDCPPTCPPTTLRINGTTEGTATYLGRFSAVSVDVVDIATSTSIGTLTFTAANGDQLAATTTGAEDAFTPPNISHVTQTATIVGGTGRFAGATGTFTIRYTATIDFATGTSSGSGSFDGQIDALMGHIQ